MLRVVLGLTGLGPEVFGISGFEGFWVRGLGLYVNACSIAMAV